MTVLQSHPSPENPEKGENPGAKGDGAGLSSLSPFSGPGTAQNAPASGAAAALAAVRAYHRAPPAEQLRAPRCKPHAPPKRPRAWRYLPEPDTLPLAGPPLPGVPLDWCEGVALLAARPVPDSIPPRRWTVLAATAVRLLRDHGAELHAHGWGTLDLFGLYAAAPADYEPGWSLAWLLGAHGQVLDVSLALVGITREADGARLAYRMTQAPARAGCLPAWNLPGVSA